ncbi:hypothetical protein UZ35_01685 [Heyndrickxia coagulans]|nr:hypothetical protein BIZ35_17340 [Heyndrickxia coagulans]KGT37391.1 hypothetical protein P421_15525 [Heyndrickxia coagulans P38]ATW84127.1 hypothetical protein CIW84_14645 [Heyndrickxia coagulans]KGB30533.1 hypothetical protein IE89_04185 [Heyndrickxia coagulans]KXT21934.1 hypothetical protein UZ35_01685 [Heyndrickxia coagulans]
MRNSAASRNAARAVKGAKTPIHETFQGYMGLNTADKTFRHTRDIEDRRVIRRRRPLFKEREKKIPIYE